MLFSFQYGRFIVLILAFLSSGSLAQDTEINRLSLIIKEKQSTPESRLKAIEAGRERALLCSVCHGKDGNSQKPDVPNLASQNPVYLLDQIKKFSDGRRKDYVMNSLAKSLSAEDKINLSIFYNNMAIKHFPVDTEMARQGKKIYESQCASCHGIRGVGNANFARIAGQQPTYVIKTLMRFRENAKRSGEKETARRSSYVMESIVKNLTDQHIDALSAYIAQLK